MLDQYRSHYLGLSVPFSLLLFCGACASEASSGTPCPNLAGVWLSDPYNALSVSSDGARETLSDLTMSLAVSHQQGCSFQAVNEWSNQELSGSEQVAGVTNSDGSLISIAEIGEPPQGGTMARVVGRLVSGDIMEWEYVGLSSDGTRATVFSTTLQRQE